LEFGVWVGFDLLKIQNPVLSQNPASVLSNGIKQLSHGLLREY